MGEEANGTQNFSLLQNMTAGAVAGIAVCCALFVDDVLGGNVEG